MLEVLWWVVGDGGVIEESQVKLLKIGVKAEIVLEARGS